MVEPPPSEQMPVRFSRWLDVRVMSRFVAAPALGLAIITVAANPSSQDIPLLLGCLVALVLAWLPDHYPHEVGMTLMLVGSLVLGYGLSADYATRNIYTMLIYLTDLLGSAFVRGRVVLVGWIGTGMFYVGGRSLGIQTQGFTYDPMTQVTDLFGIFMLGVLVYCLAEGQRQNRQLHRLLEVRSQHTASELERTLATSRDIVMVTDGQWRIQSISPACQEILGYTPAEMVNRDPRDFIYPPDLEATAGQRHLAKSGEQVNRFENRYVHKDGRLVWLEWNASYDPEHSVIRCVARDVTERKRSEALILESEQRYRALFDANPDIILVGDASGMVTANAAFAQVTGYDPKYLRSLDRNARLDLLFAGLPEERELWLVRFAVASRGLMTTTDLRVTHRSGALIHLEATFIPLVSEGENQGVYVVAKDVTQRWEAEVAQARLAAVLEATTDFVTQTTPDGTGLYLNQAARAMAGEIPPTDWSLAQLYAPESLRLMNKVAIPAAIRNGSWSGEAVWRGASGIEVPVSQVILAHRGRTGSVEYLSIISRDIGERKRFEARLAHLAAHDTLTGLLNRHGFEQALADRLHGAPGAILYLDLDEFKYVNDSLGHRTGDELLRNLAALLRERMRPDDLIARLSGDEFVIMLTDTDAPTAQRIAEEVLEALRQRPVPVANQSISITASIGMAFYPEHGSKLEELLAHADHAMYRAKEKGRNLVSVYELDRDYASRVEQRITWERLIRAALAGNGLILFGQPILDLTSTSISHYELLLRMQDDRGGLVPPGTFLQVAERFGLIQQIDRWVVREAIHLLARSALAGLDIFLEVNLSGKALTDPELLALIRRELAETQVAPHRLVFEITETAAIADFDVAYEFIQVLKSLGCRFALDDFGAGFSSFDRLKRLPVDYLKLDGSFIRNLPKSEEDQHLVKAMVEVARSLGKRTIAEFVEDAATVHLLREAGVDYAQGYHVGRPVPVSQIWPQMRRDEATAG